MMKPKAKVPFEFVLEALSPLEPSARPMFGAHGVYVGPKIVFILRNRESHPEANGIWVATQKEHHLSLKKIFPSLTSISVLSTGKGETDWQMIPYASDSFESDAFDLCELVLKNDPRIGRIPKKKAAKKSKA
jgi:hypothetical protein